MVVERPGYPQSLDEPEAVGTFEGYIVCFLKDVKVENDSNFQVYQTTRTTTKVSCYGKTMEPGIRYECWSNEAMPHDASKIAGPFLAIDTPTYCKNAVSETHVQ